MHTRRAPPRRPRFRPASPGLAVTSTASGGSPNAITATSLGGTRTTTAVTSRRTRCLTCTSPMSGHSFAPSADERARLVPNQEPGARRVRGHVDLPRHHGLGHARLLADLAARGEVGAGAGGIGAALRARLSRMRHWVGLAALGTGGVARAAYGLGDLAGGAEATQPFL